MNVLDSTFFSLTEGAEALRQDSSDKEGVWQAGCWGFRVDPDIIQRDSSPLLAAILLPRLVSCVRACVCMCARYRGRCYWANLYAVPNYQGQDLLLP